MASQDIAQRVRDAVGNVLQAEGYDLLLVEHVPGILRLYIDREDGAGVSLEDCSVVSRLVGDVFDAEGLSDAIAGRFHLEVSSPGMDRPLTRPKDFCRFVGHQVRLNLASSVEGQKRLAGHLLAADEAGIRVQSEGKEWPLSYDQIRKARLVPEYDVVGSRGRG